MRVDKPQKDDQTDHVSKRTQDFSIPSLSLMIQTEADAYRMLEELRWGGEPPACPKCGVIGQTYYMAPRDGSKARKTRTGSLSQRRVWKCRACRKQFALVGNDWLLNCEVQR
jgi:hypothetical protein